MNNIEKIMNIELKQKETPIMKAAQIGNIENLNIILKSTDIFNGIEINQAGENALIIAILSNQKESVKAICNASEKLEDAKLMKEQLMKFKFNDDNDLNHYAIHKINNVIFNLKMKESLAFKYENNKTLGNSENLALG